MSSYVPDDYVTCSNCDYTYDHDDAKKCPTCENKVVCPACTYCHECQLLVDDMPMCDECGIRAITDDDLDVCDICLDEEE